MATDQDVTHPADEFEPTFVVYIGRRLMKRDKLGQAFALLSDLEDGKLEMDIDLLLYDRAITGPTVGGVYQVPMNQAGTGRFSKAVLMSAYEDRAQVDKWVVLDAATAREKERRNAEKRLAKESRDIGEMTLDQLRTMIATQPQHVADGTILIVLRFLTGRR
jgi:hypothetical protein